MKARSLFFLLIVVASFFLVAIIVNAEGCCLKTKGDNGQYCVSERDGASAANCESSMWFSEDCDAKDQCKNKGCCYVDNDCRDDQLEIKCIGSAGEFSSGNCESTPRCKKLCCQASDEESSGYFYTTQSGCDAMQGVEKSDVTDEASCENLNRGLDAQRGCCVLDSGECKRMLNDECNRVGSQPPYEGFFCRDVGACDPKCEGKYRIGPGNPRISEESNKIYWYDSCGNQEDLVDETDPIEAFKHAGFDEPFNGDCDADPSSAVVLTNEGQFTCANLVCNNIWDNPRTDENYNGNLRDDNFFDFAERRSFRYNGESWCEYVQAKVGFGLDLPGTRHYLHYCERGNERVDEKASDGGRDYVCAESFLDKTKRKTDGTQVTYTMTNATWIKNNAADCFKCNDKAVVDSGHVLDCCRQKQTCSYVFRKAIKPDTVIININEQEYNNIKDSVGKANRFLKLRYKISDSVIKEENLLSAVRIPGSCSGGCNLEIINPPVGEYEVFVYGRGCDSLGLICETREVTLGKRTFKPADLQGVCLPLIAPTGNEFCSSFADYGFSKVDTSVSYNYYYDLPYVGFGFGDECQNTSGCIDLLYKKTNNLNNLKSSEGSLIMLDNIYSLCSAFGDCGYKPNLLGINISSSLNAFSFCPRGSDSGCVYFTYSEVIKLQGKKFLGILNGTPSRPEIKTDINPLFFGLPLSLFRRKKNKKMFIAFLILLHLILIACEEGGRYLQGHPDLQSFDCNKLIPASGAADCGKCNANWSSGGILPDINLTTADGKLVYQCTPELCYSLGVKDQQCEFVPNKEAGGLCITKESFNIPRISFVGANYSCSSLNRGGCSASSYHIENSESPYLFIDGNLEENIPLTISFKTINVKEGSGNSGMPAFCYYSKNKDTGDDRRLKKLNSIDSEDGGNLKIEHNFDIAGKPLGQYNYFIQCEDQAGDITTVGNIRFSVARGPDIGAPRIARIEPSDGTIYVKNGIYDKDVTIFVNGRVNLCRWDNKSVRFEEMGVVTNVCRGCSNDGRDIIDRYVGPNSFSCRVDSESGLSVCPANLKYINLGSNKFWFACNGTNGKISEISPENGYEIISTSSLNITDVSCEHSLGNGCDKIYDNYFNFLIKTSGGAESGRAQCRWAPDGYDYDSFTEPGFDYRGLITVSKYGIVHKKLNYAHDTGVVKMNFLCNDVAGNIAQKSLTISIERDVNPPKITKSYRYGNELYVQTNEISNCYYISSTFGSFDNSTQFTTSDGLEHHTSIETNFYRIRCEDKFNNKKDMDIYISKLQ